MKCETYYLRKKKKKKTICIKSLKSDFVILNNIAYWLFSFYFMSFLNILGSMFEIKQWFETGLLRYPFMH